MDIALAALSASCKDLRLVRGHIRHYPAALCVAYYSTSRHLYNKGLCAFASAVSSAAVFPAVSHIFPLIPEIYQGREIVIDLKNDIAAASAVAAVGTACRYILFAVKRYSAVAAVTCFDHYFRLINEHFRPPFLKKNPKRKLGIYCHVMAVTAQSRKQKPSYGHVRNAQTLPYRLL